MFPAVPKGLVHARRQNHKLVFRRQSSTIVRRRVAGADGLTKFPDHVGFVSHLSTDKIGDLSVNNRGFCL